MGTVLVFLQKGVPTKLTTATLPLGRSNNNRGSPLLVDTKEQGKLGSNFRDRQL